MFSSSNNIARKDKDKDMQPQGIYLFCSHCKPFLNEDPKFSILFVMDGNNNLVCSECGNLANADDEGDEKSDGSQDDKIQIEGDEEGNDNAIEKKVIANFTSSIVSYNQNILELSRHSMIASDNKKNALRNFLKFNGMLSLNYSLGELILMKTQEYDFHTFQYSTTRVQKPSRKNKMEVPLKYQFKNLYTLFLIFYSFNTFTITL